MAVTVFPSSSLIGWNLPSAKRAAPVAVPIHNDPSWSRCNASTRPAGKSASVTAWVRRPSNFARPASVPNHIEPSVSCAIACTRSEGRP